MLATYLFAISAVQIQPDLMSLETPAMSAVAVVQELGKASGQTLAADPDLSREILFIKVKDAEVQAVMDRVATVALAKWEDRNGTLTLLPDPAARRAQADEALASSIQKVEKTFAYWENLNEDNYDSDYGDLSKEEIANIKAMQETARAEQKAFVHLLRAVGAKKIAAMEPGARMVFSDHPTAMQSRLNGPWASFYASIKQRKEAGNYEYGDMSEGFGDEGIPPEMAEYMNIQRAFAAQTKPFNGVPVKLLLVFQRPSLTGAYASGMPPSCMATLFAMDQNGSYTYVTSTAFENYEEMEDAAPNEGEGEGAAPQVPQGRPLKINEEEYDLGTGLYGSAMTDKVRNRFLGSFSDPSKDPLDVVGGTLLRVLSRSGDYNVVANVPDVIAQSRYFLSKEYNNNSTIETLIESLNYTGTKIDEKDGWLVVSPTDFGHNQAVRLDRPTLAGYAASLSRGPLRLDASAEFLYRNPYASSNGLYQMLREMNPAANSWTGMENAGMLRFWGSLSDSQRRTLRTSGTVNLGSLSKGSRDLLAYYVYNTELPLQMPPPDAVKAYGAPAQMLLSYMSWGAGGGITSWVNEPTESLPQGLPANGVVRLEQWSETCFVPESSQASPTIPGVIGATEMIMLDAYRQAAPAEAQAALNALPTRAFVGTRTNMTLTVQFAPQIQTMGTLSDIEISKDGRTVSLTALPADLKASIDETRKKMGALEGFMKYMIGSMGEGEGGQRPPP